ncbi:hypothetical protein GOP47_0015190 [Adiantum capillus-veneris]|uniref:Decapping nuclease n=1 Tax=Adiantum capillus-veneris TaxID=13818 RepID=A0A9D4UNE8_ADICA|nr:hypothetical protein GOP47_0015190 [Adiantum capillus-veneris]
MVDIEEDYNVDAYDDDLFGASNEDYCNCQATSPLPIPELPQFIWPSGNSNFRGNPGHLGRQQSRGGRQRYDDKLVADMKLGNNLETLSHKCPPFQEPCEIACYSRTTDGNVYFDDRCLRRLRHTVFQEIGADLNVGYETFVEKVEDPDGFSDLLDCLRGKNIPLDNIHFVTFRNNLNKIMGTAYNRSEPWEMGVHKRRGTVYLDVRKLPEGPCDERQRRMMYWGYSFEQLATEHETSEVEPDSVDANAEYCVLIRTKLGAHRIIMGAEIDCYDGMRDGKRQYIELKTSRELDSRTVERFQRDKLLKFWIQSFLAGVSKIVCAFRDDNGYIMRTEIMRTREITQRVKERNLWQGGVCLAFADQVLCWLYGSVKENEDYLLRYNPQSDRLELRKADFCPQSITNHVNELT